MDEKLTECLQKVKADAPGAFDELSAMYRPLVLSLVDSFEPSMPEESQSREDLLQEANLALYRAAISFDQQQNAVTFGLYAKICIKNRLISALRRQKRLMRKQTQVSTVVSPPVAAPDFDITALKNQYGHLLTRYEAQVLDLRLRDLCYREIARKLGKDPKSVDNALCRIRQKLRAAKKG